MPSKTSKIIGWVLSTLLFLLLAGPSAMSKFTDWPGKEEMLKNLGVTNDVLIKIGVVEVIVAVMYIVPRTSFLGAILLTGYLGGAIMAHVRAGEAFAFQFILGVVAWVALGLRDGRIFKLAFGKCETGCTAKASELPTGSA